MNTLKITSIPKHVNEISYKVIKNLILFLLYIGDKNRIKYSV